jgi:hypothetical protein
MSKFTFQIVNHRGDESQLYLLLTATSDAGLGSGYQTQRRPSAIKKTTLKIVPLVEASTQTEEEAHETS